MYSLPFACNDKGEDLLLSKLEAKGWETTKDKTINNGTKYKALKGDTECRFVVYKNKNNEYTKIVVEKSIEPFDILFNKITEEIANANTLNKNQTSKASKTNKTTASKVDSNTDETSIKASKTVQTSKRETKQIPHFSIRIGTDETGKGDYFGPLVVAGVCLDDKTEEKLKSLKVSDSKKHNDAVNESIKNKLLEILSPSQYSIKIIPPIKYNAMMKDIGNTNNILAIAHTAVIRDLLDKNPKCKDVIVDQFASENLLEFYLSKEIKSGLRLFQTPKGERDTAVAAASMIARGTLIDEFKKMENELRVNVPFGAGSNVDAVAKDIAKKILSDKMGEFVKISFANTKRVLE